MTPVLAVGDTAEFTWVVPQFYVITPEACKQLVGQTFPLRQLAGTPGKAVVLRALAAKDGLSVQLLVQRTA